MKCSRFAVACVLAAAALIAPATGAEPGSMAFASGLDGPGFRRPDDAPTAVVPIRRVVEARFPSGPVFFPADRFIEIPPVPAVPAG